nr:phage holin family protein [Bacillus atrophaeus]
MGKTSVLIDFETLDLARVYLFGGVKYLDLLLILSIINVITGIIKAWKLKRHHSRSAWFGYVRKMLSFLVANVVDTITNLNGVITFGTVLFYIANEGLSITENLAQNGVKIPAVITDGCTLSKVITIRKQKKRNKLLNNTAAFLKSKNRTGEIFHDN